MFHRVAREQSLLALTVAVCCLCPGLVHLARGDGSPFYDWYTVATEDSVAAGAPGQLSFPIRAEGIHKYVSVNDAGRTAFGVQLHSDPDPGASGCPYHAVVVENQTLTGLDYCTGMRTNFSSGCGLRLEDWFIQINNDDQITENVTYQDGGESIFRFDANKPGGVSPGYVVTGEQFIGSSDGSLFIADELIHMSSRSEDGWISFVSAWRPNPSPPPWSNNLFVVGPGGGIPQFVDKLPDWNPPTSALYMDPQSPPMISTGGVMVILYGTETNGSLRRYQPGGSFEMLASTDDGWGRISQMPACTVDGSAVTFVGQDPTGTEGLYFQLADATLGFATTRVLDTNSIIAYGDNVRPIRFQSFEFKGRNPVIRYDVGDDGDVVGDSFIIAFVATPDGASRTNPASPPAPLLFSDQKGVWTIRVDVERKLGDTNSTVLHTSTLLPVLQIGDLVGGNTVTNIFLWDALGRATLDPEGQPRNTVSGLPTPGDHVLAFFAETTVGPLALKGYHLDSDGDGLLDHWERVGGGIDMDRDEIVDLDLYTMGARDDRRDLFLEVDWLAPQPATKYPPAGWLNEPHPGALADLAGVFALAPITNADGSVGVVLHIDAGGGSDEAGDPFSQNISGGSLQGGDEITTPGGAHPDVVYMGVPRTTTVPGLEILSMHEAKDGYFGTIDKRARELAFRYCVLADFHTEYSFAQQGGVSQQVRVAAANSISIATQPTDINLDGNNDVTISNGGAILVNSSSGGSSVPQVRPIRWQRFTNSALQIVIDGPDLDPVPSPGDEVVILDGSGGNSEVLFRSQYSGFASNDFHSLPGNDLLLTLAGYGVGSGLRLGQPENHSRIIAHEFGHTIGLRHGGTSSFCSRNGDTFWSIMSYTHQNRINPGERLHLGGAWCPGYPNPAHSPRYQSVTGTTTAAPTAKVYYLNPPAGFASASSVPPYFAANPARPGIILSYSDGGDPLGLASGYSDWDYAKMDVFRSLHFVGNTYRKSARGDAFNPGHDHQLNELVEDPFTYPTVDEITDFDQIAPVLTVLSPTSLTTVAVSGTLTVSVHVVDDYALEYVQVHFDLNGDGSTTGAMEIVAATDVGSNSYTAVVTPITGPEASRDFQIRARDRSGNMGIATPRIRVGSATLTDHNPPVLTITAPLANERVATGAWAVVEVEAFDGSGVNSVAVAFDLDGDGVTNGLGEVVNADAYGGGKHVAFLRDVTGPTNTRQIRVTADDVWMNRRTITRDIQVTPLDTVPPDITITNPPLGEVVPLATSLWVYAVATDNQVVDDVDVFFDMDGDGDTTSSGESKDASHLGGGVYRAVFYGALSYTSEGVSGPPGNRDLTVVAVDGFDNTTVVTQVVLVADTQRPTVTITSPPPQVAVGPAAPLSVAFYAYDDQGLGSLTASYDRNGNGSLLDVGDSVAATPLGGSNYMAQFGPLSGPVGPRMISVTAIDVAAKTTTAARATYFAENVVVRHPVTSAEVAQSGTFRVNVETVLGLTTGTVRVYFDLNGDGDTDDAGETTSAFDEGLDRYYTTAFSDIGGPAGMRTILVEVVDSAMTTSLLEHVVRVGSFDGYPSAVSEKLGSAPHMFELNDDGSAGQGLPESFIGVGSNLVFTARDAVTGRELWRSDGTPEGTILLKNLSSGILGASVGEEDRVAVLHDVAYFAAADAYESVLDDVPVTGSELWRSDGTPEGTYMFKDIRPGESSSFAKWLVVSQDRIYFRASDGLANDELFVSDGTVTGTTAVADFEPSLQPEMLTVVGTSIYFRAGDNGYELWRTDGTSNGTVQVRSHYREPDNLIAMGDHLFFTVIDEDHGRELWMSDGTSNGTVRLSDFVPGPVLSTFDNFMPANGLLFFTHDDAPVATTYGNELHVSDGTTNGTRLLKDIRPGLGDSDPLYLTPYNGYLYFSAWDGTSNGRELWRTDGTETGTVLAVDIAPDGSSSPAYLSVFDGLLYFRADDQTHLHGRELWRTDGTPEGTVLVADLFPGHSGTAEAYGSEVQNIYVFNGRIYFSAADGHLDELWVSDGTAAGTRMLRNLENVFADPPVSACGPLFFPGSDLVRGEELWIAETSGVHMAYDLYPGAKSAFPSNLQVVGEHLYFSAFNRFSDPPIYTDLRGLWKTDGSETGLQQLAEFKGMNPARWENLVELGGIYLFRGVDQSGEELWRTDGTSNGTMRLKDIYPGVNSGSPALPTRMGDNIYFSANDGATGTELWRTDGSETGTLQVADINPGSANTELYYLTPYSNVLVFYARTTNYGRELWKSDGTAGGTELVKDIQPGTGHGFDTSAGGDVREPYTLHNDQLFFPADDGTYGTELWKSDATEAGTVIATNLKYEYQSSSPGSITELGGKLFFAALGDGVSRELYLTEGTGDVTRLVRNIAGIYTIPGTGIGEGAAAPGSFVEMNGLLFFLAYDHQLLSVTGGNHGRELWRSDGTEFGTVIVRDVLPGAGSPDIDQITVVSGHLYFVANDAVHGRELWTSDGSYEGTHVVEDLLPGQASSLPSGLVAADGALYYFANDGAPDLSVRKVVPSTNTPYWAWIGMFPGLAGEERGQGADPDEDGLSNITEFDLSTNPDDTFSGPIVELTEISTDELYSYVNVTFVQRRDLRERGLGYVMDFSLDLLAWGSLASLVSETTNPIDALFEEVTRRYRIFTPSDRVFGRMRLLVFP